MIDRRSFIKQTALATAGALVLPHVSCADGGSKVDALPKKAIGIQLYSLRDEIPGNVSKVISRVVDAGYKEVEVFGFSTSAQFWGLSPKKFADLLGSNGLKAVSGHYDFDSFFGPGNSMDGFNSYLEAAAALNHKYLTVPSVSDQYRKTADDYKVLAGKFNKAAGICKQAGLKFAYHNHDTEFKNFDGISGYDILLNETDADLVKFEMDIFWVVKAGKDPVEMFKKNPGRYELWHVKDMDKNNSSLNTEIGKGTIDFKKVFQSASQAGLQHIIVEQENFSIDPFLSIKESADYIKENLVSGL